MRIVFLVLLLVANIPLLAQAQTNKETLASPANNTPLSSIPPQSFARPAPLRCADKNFTSKDGSLKTLQQARSRFLQARQDLLQAARHYIEVKTKEIGKEQATDLYQSQWAGKLKLAYFGILNSFNKAARSCSPAGNAKAAAAAIALTEITTSLSRHTKGATIRLEDYKSLPPSSKFSKKLPWNKQLLPPPVAGKKRNLPALALAACRKKYGNRLSRVTIRGKSIICHFKASRKQRLANGWKRCRKKYGNRLSRVTLSKRGITCHYKRTAKERLRHARRICKRKWGKRYIRTTLKGKRITCHYKRSRHARISPEEARRRCRAKYGNRLVSAKVRDGKIVCRYRK